MDVQVSTNQACATNKEEMVLYIIHPSPGFACHSELAFIPYILFNVLQFNMHTKGVNVINVSYSLHMQGLKT